MRNLTLFWALVFSVFISFSGTALAADAVYDDLWDISQGVMIRNHSAVINYDYPAVSDIRDMFGNKTAYLEGGKTVFGDGNGEGFVHYVEWETPDSITLQDFNLLAIHADGTCHRTFDKFNLYYGDGQGIWTNIYTWSLRGDTYGEDPDNLREDNLLELEVTLTNPVVAKYFRAEFTQADVLGPRIIELDGYGITGSPVPVPGAVWLLGTGLISLAGIRRRNISS